MDWTSLILLSFALCFDSVAVSTVVGMCSGKNEAPILRRILRFCFILALMQGLMPFAGWLIAFNFKHLIEEWDHWIAFALLFVIGSKMIADYFKKDDEEDSKCHYFMEYTSLSHSMLLGIATSIDALIVGISMAFLNLEFTGDSQFANMLTASIVIAAVTFVCSFSGALLGKIGSGKLSQKSSIIGGIILILIGVKILLEHLNIF